MELVDMVMFDSVEFIPLLLIETEACALIFDAEILLTLGALLEATEVLGDELGSTENELGVAEASSVQCPKLPRTIIRVANPAVMSQVLFSLPSGR